MGYPEIHVNTSDASNLYVIDYHGGSGGEFLGELVAAATNCKHTRNKTKNDSTSVDSFRNILVSPFVNDGLQDTIYLGSKNTDTFQGEVLVKNLIAMNYWQSKKIEPSQQARKDSINHIITDRVLLRNHLPERDFSLLPKRNHVYLYADDNDYHITLPLMFAKQWMTKRKNGEYTWEWANQQRKLGYKTFEDFVDGFFLDTKNAKTISTVDTTYGINVSPKEYAFNIGNWKEDIETYIGAKIPIDTTEWHNNNLQIMKSFGLTIDSTQQECIDRIKYVYSRNFKR